MEVLTKRYFYLYLIRDSVTGCTYLGQRSSKKPPAEDIGYWGSGVIVTNIRKRDGLVKLRERCPKLILFDHYQSQKELDEAEEFWIQQYWDHGMSEWNFSKGHYTNKDITRPSAELASERSKKAAASRTPEQRSASAKRATASVPREKLLEMCKKSGNVNKIKHFNQQLADDVKAGVLTHKQLIEKHDTTGFTISMYRKRLGIVAENKVVARYCCRCGSKLITGQERFCSMICSRKVNRPSVEQLKDDLVGSSFLAVGRKYGVSDNCIRKWIKLDSHLRSR
jgi:hypothetical protein